EAEANGARRLGVRVAVMRLGVVLGRDGGAYPKMSGPFRMFLGGPIGMGRRWMSWVHVEDAARLAAHLLDHKDAEGPFNGTAPEPVSNAEFARTLGSVLRRPALFPTPPFVLRLPYGASASVILASQRVLPMRTQASGYAFKFPTLRAALEDLR
ncbi:MAG: DUF1731 domain-containing protein, partial [Planctomycetota bacterium]